MTQESNPILDPSFRIPFDRIRPEHVVPGIRRALDEAREEVEEVVRNPDPPTWETTLAPLEKLIERVRRRCTPVQHLLSVAESPELREAWGEVLPQVSRFWSWLFLQPELWDRIKRYSETAEADRLDALRARHLDRTMRDFRRSGADLPPEGRERLETIDVELARLQQLFSENILDATAAYALHITDQDRLRGIPEDARARFHRRAQADRKKGWILTLDQPAFEAVVKYAEDRDLRAEIHAAFLARGASDPWDNRGLIPEILELRKERARLLGYENFPDYRLEEHMVGSGARARKFVSEMAERTRPHWARDFSELSAHALKLGIDPMEPWDTAFVIERLRKEKFDLDEEEVRPYFPVESVIRGLFDVTHHIFGLRVEEAAAEGVWHEDVRYFELHEEDGMLLGAFYTDLYPRPEKRQGAWMNDFIYGGPTSDGAFLPHLGVMCANFPPPDGDRPALLTHRDVETLFHEFGHLLHHLTSQVAIAQRGGINVAWDWVELPSQLLENWCWEREALDLFARHWKSGEKLPDELFARLQRARRFMGGWRQMRQLGFGALDLALHTEYSRSHGDPIAWTTRLLEPLSPNPRFAAAHPLSSFMHIFSGGYAAAYYSYLWSEVLEADLFTRFKERGIFDRPTGRTYLETILSAGDRDAPEALFRAFMGREPDPEALITRNLGEAA